MNPETIGEGADSSEYLFISKAAKGGTTPSNAEMQRRLDPGKGKWTLALNHLLMILRKLINPENDSSRSQADAAKGEILFACLGVRSR